MAGICTPSRPDLTGYRVGDWLIQFHTIENLVISYTVKAQHAYCLGVERIMYAGSNRATAMAAYDQAVAQAEAEAVLTKPEPTRAPTPKESPHDSAEVQELLAIMQIRAGASLASCSGRLAGCGGG